MAKLQLVVGTTSKTVKVFIQDSSKATGAGLTGLVYNTAGLTGYYIIEGAASTVAISLATATLGTWATGGFIVVDGTNMPGVYELSIPNLAIASGKSCLIYLQGAANMAPLVLEIELTAVNNQSTGFGLVNASANAVQLAGQTITAAAGVTFPTSVASPTNITAGTITTVTNLTNAATAGDLTAAMKTSVTTAATAATPTAAAVTGAVGSVTSGVTVTTNNDKTGYSLTQAFPANFSSLGITAGGAAKVDGTSALTESYAAQGAALTLAQGIYGMNQLMSQQAIVGTTLTTKKRDGATVAKTYTLDSSTSPTLISETT